MKYPAVRNYVGGALVSADLPTLDVYDPGAGAIISGVPLSSRREVDQVVEGARAAFPGWSGTPIKEGLAVEEGGLRNLQGVLLVEIERAGELIAPVGPEQVLRGGDELNFVGRADVVVDLQSRKGLVSAQIILGASGGDSVHGALIGIVLATLITTELITNNAAAALLFPIAVAGAAQLGVDPRPVAIAVAVAASNSFLTPIGYQTNTMVHGPGGYRFTDYVRVGLPLTITTVITMMAIIPWWWGL